jgi:shikimate dehydrogenase
MGLRGHNTDLAGIAQAFETAGHDCTGQQVLLLGAGGAARAAAVALHRMNVAGITVAARRLTAAEELIAALPAEHRPADFRAIELTPDLDTRPFGLLVNATPVGQWPRVDEVLLGAGQLHRGQAVFDMVYHPDDTQLLQRARSLGCRVISGLDMFVGQALASLELWFPGSTGFGTGSLQAAIDPAALRKLLRGGSLESTGRTPTVETPEASV